MDFEKTMPSCDICCEEFTSQRRKPIKCLYKDCQQVACLECIKEYSKDIKEGNYNCMFCKKEMSNYDLRLICQEKSFPDRMLKPKVAGYIKDQKSLLPNSQADAKFARDLVEYRKFCADIERQKSLLDRQKDAEWRRISLNHKETKKQVYEIHIKCAHADCLGYLNKAYVCGTCEKKTCPKCREPIMDDGEEHVCDENTVLTVENIRKNCKPCPNKVCGASIVKASGCDQMTCTKCYTIFEWKTGRIIDPNKEIIHNPHYIEYMRKNNITNAGNNPRLNDMLDDGGCVRPFDNVQFQRYIYTSISPFIREVIDPRFSEYNYSQSFSNFWRFGNDYRYVLGRYNQDYEEIEKDLRVKYINKQITEAEWEKKLKNILMARDKKEEISKIMHQFRNSLADIIINISSFAEDKITEKTPYTNQIKHIHKLVELFNINLKECCDIYRIKQRKIEIYEESWRSRLPSYNIKFS